MKRNLFSRVGLVAVAMATVAFAPAVQAQTSIRSNTLALITSTVTAGAQSNVFRLTAGAPFTAPTAVDLRNAPLGVNISIPGNCPTNAYGQIGIGFQTSIDGVNFGNNLLWAILPAGSSGTNFVITTNFSQAVLGNAQKIRIGSQTNGSAATATFTNGVALSYY